MAAAACILAYRRTASDFPEQQGAVGTTKAERVGHRVAYGHRLRLVRHKIQVTPVVRIIEIDGGWCYLIANRQHEKIASIAPAAPVNALSWI
jgi:hypothetical protein